MEDEAGFRSVCNPGDEVQRTSSREVCCVLAERSQKQVLSRLVVWTSVP